MGDRLVLWLKQNPDWRKTHLPAALEYDERLKNQIPTTPSKWELKNVVRVASLCGSFIFKVLIPLSIVAAAVGLYFGIAYLYQHWVWETFFTVLAALGILIGGVTAIVLIAMWHNRN